MANACRATDLVKMQWLTMVVLGVSNNGRGNYGEEETMVGKQGSKEARKKEKKNNVEKIERERRE